MPKRPRDRLTQLGQPARLPASPDAAVLERVANPHPGSTYLVRFTAPEFTVLCPITGQPDFAHLVIDYVPRRWRVENSWGDENGQNGFFVMNDSWFDEHMFEVAARKRYLPPTLRKALALPPIVLPPWDPMGSLAG